MECAGAPNDGNRPRRGQGIRGNGMTIARNKLWIGFGIVVLIFLAASLIILVSQRFIDSAIDEIANVEAPTRDASQEMEIN